jgi:hypothetical protein
MRRNQTTEEYIAFLRSTFLVSGDAPVLLASLSKLMRHLREPPFVTGSIASGWHLLRHGMRRKKSRLNDLDIVVEGLSSLCLSLAQEFLIVHFHPFRERGKILIQLVDEEYGVRIDVFTPGSSSLASRLTDFTEGDLSFKFVSAEDLLAKQLADIYPATSGEPVEPKYVEQFHLLHTIAELNVAREVWRDYRKESQPLDFEEAAGAAERSITANAGLLRAGRYSKDINQSCVWCCESELFPLAARSRVFEILGYV